MDITYIGISMYYYISIYYNNYSHMSRTRMLWAYTQSNIFIQIFFSLNFKSWREVLF